MSGTTQKAEITKTTPEQNRALVMEAFDTLFNKRDYATAERFWSPDYIQHSAHIAPGREGLFDLIKSTPPKFKYEPGMIVAEGDLVIVHGRSRPPAKKSLDFDKRPNISRATSREF